MTDETDPTEEPLLEGQRVFNGPRGIRTNLLPALNDLKDRFL